MTELTDSDSQPLLRSLPRPVVSAALRSLPDAAEEGADEREVVLVMRITCVRKHYDGGGTSLRYWVADHATVEPAPA